MSAIANSSPDLAARLKGVLFAPGTQRLLAVAGLIALGLFSGTAIAVTGTAGALILVAILVCLFTVRDFRVGVVVLILIMPISSSYLFPHSMFGVTGLNPLNLLLAMTLGLYLFRAIPDGSVKYALPLWVFALYVLPLFAGGLHGMDKVELIPPQFYLTNQIDYKDEIGYLRDTVVKPLFLVLFAVLVGGAYARSKDPERWLTPTLTSIWLMGGIVLGYVVISGARLDQLAGTYARHFFSPLGMHANDLGRLYACAYAILLFTWDSSVRPARKTALFLSMGVACAALLVTFSKAGFIGFILVNLIYLCSRRNLKTLALAAFFIPVGLYFVSGAVWYRLTMGVDEGASAVSAGRITDIWQPLLPDLFDHPIIGHGIQSVLWMRPMRMGEMFEVTHPHSAYLQALLDFGLVGFVLLVAFWLIVWRNFRRLAHDAQLAPEEQGFFEGAAAALIGFLVAGLVGSSLAPVPEQSFLWLAFGMMVGVRARP